MNKPIAIVCAGIVGIGLLILVVCLYYTLAYGHGNFEAGSFHRSMYWTEQDAATGKTVKRWDTNWELTESTEGSPLYRIDTWLVGIGLVVLGTAIWVADWSCRHKTRPGNFIL